MNGDEQIIDTAKRILKNLGIKKHKEDLIVELSNICGYRYNDLHDLLLTGTGTTTTTMVMSTNDGDRYKYTDSKARRKSRGYLKAVDEVVEWNEECSSASASAGKVLGEEQVVVAERVKNVLSMLMSITEDEFRRGLRDTVPIDVVAGRMYDPIILNHSFAVFYLKELADRMIRAGYEKECGQVYICVRRDVIDECLIMILGVDKLGKKLAHKIDNDWRSLDVKMKKWSEAVKVVLAGEKQLCDKVFSGPRSESLREVCFDEISRSCVMQLITFALEIICTTLKCPASEKLFRTLDIYDALADVLPDLQAAILSDNSCQLLCRKVQGILDLLRLSANGTVKVFENVIKGNVTYHMLDYFNLIVDYSDRFLPKSNSCNSNGAVGDGGGGDSKDNVLDFGNGSLLERPFLLLVSSFESEIEEKSKFYEDRAMKYIFLMKNILYLVDKVTGSALGKLLGDQWVRKHHVQIRQYAACFLRACSSKGLSSLKGKCVVGGGSSANVYNKMALKDRLKNFICSWGFRRNASAKECRA